MKSESQILLFDPDSSAVDTFRKMLEDAYAFTSVSSVDACLSSLESGVFHVLILDESVFGKAGSAFWEKFADSSEKATIILAGSRKGSNRLIDAVNTVRVHRYLRKPWEKNELMETLSSAIEDRAEREEDDRLVYTLYHSIDEMKFLRLVSQKISEKKTLPRLLKEIMESSKMLMKAEASSLLLYDPDDRQLHFFVATGRKGRMIKKFSLALGEGIAGWVAKHKKPLLIEDCYEDPRFNPEYDRQTHFRTKSMMCVPLIRKRRLLGVIQVINREGEGVFTEKDLNLFMNLASQCAIAIENHRLTEIQIKRETLERELEIARVIQQRLLPASLPEYSDIQIATYIIPAKQVGGDYYNIMKINDELSLFFVADVSGKGLPAALVVSTIHSCMLSYMKLNQDRFDLIGLVQAMNSVLIDSTTSRQFVTCWFGLYRHDRREMKSVNAGHNPPYVFRENSENPMEIGTTGLCLGAMEFQYRMMDYSLDRGDVLVFYTDGVTEACDRDHRLYSPHRLVRVVQAHLDEDSAGILSRVRSDIEAHVGNAEQSDDLTCAVLKIL